MSVEAEMLIAEWMQEHGPITPMTAVDLISWVLAHERRHETAGHRQTCITDEGYLIKLGYRQERDGSWHLDDGHPDRGTSKERPGG